MFNRCPQAELPTGGLEDTEPSRERAGGGPPPARSLRRMAERHSFWPASSRRETIEGAPQFKRAAMPDLAPRPDQTGSQCVQE